MLVTAAALLPGVATMTWVYGAGVLRNVLIMTGLTLAVELICLVMRGHRTLAQFQNEAGNFSWLITAWLIAVCLPPDTDVIVMAWAALAAIGLAKHAYGGIGHNVFNPAMAGYAVVLTAFADRVDHWPLPASIDHTPVDALTGATQLSFFRYQEGFTTAEFESAFAPILAQQEWIALAFLAGGLGLLAVKVIAWRVTLGMFAGLTLGVLAFFDAGSSSSLGSLTFHLASGGFMVAAFFVVTDPVTHPRTPQYQWALGLFCGLMIVVIRGFGAYPDGIAFAVLLANCCTPLLNRASERGQTAAAARAERS